MMKKIRIGLIGAGYIGRAHAIAYTQAPTVFPLAGRLVCEITLITHHSATARVMASASMIKKQWKSGI
ncbi:hypothetical protein [Photorhabdus tasmaniensis]|uniref:Gfo/Idh/MocA-like oxidoreductase N-terminal domain-containing protein n=1 Tax=Photorhabdus tasmaniensis TaxID=1004159 RepID=A0ABX0GHI7_9GAMM|nr:hypothetical protein [Photorhabdus tasmaniensis]NHB87743.1 hypothetical protein [Photorhabdus tasmaniensis]